jgi:hypothetical protein
MVAARALAPRLAAVLLALAAVAGCEQARQVSQGVDKAGACARVLKEVSGLNLDPQSAARAASQASDTAKRLEDTARNLDQSDVRNAAEALADRIQKLADTTSSSTPAQREQAVRDVTQAASRLASACNVPIDQVVRTG